MGNLLDELREDIRKFFGLPFAKPISGVGRRVDPVYVVNHLKLDDLYSNAAALTQNVWYDALNGGAVVSSVLESVFCACFACY